MARIWGLYQNPRKLFTERKTEAIIVQSVTIRSDNFIKIITHTINMGDNSQKEGEEKKVKRLVCEKCDSKFVYVLVDKTIVCRRCSYRSSPKDD